MPARIANKARQAGAAALAPGRDLPIPVPRLLAAVHAQRADLQARFDLADPGGRDGFLTWCLTEGRSDYPAVADLVSCGAFAGLHDPDPSCPSVWPTPLTGLMRVAWHARADARAAFPLPERAEEFVWWFFLHGARELGLDPLVPAAAREDLGRPVLLQDDPRSPPISRLMHRIWRVRPDLQRAFDPRTADGRIGFARWFLAAGMAELDLGWLAGPGLAAWMRVPCPSREIPAPANVAAAEAAIRPGVDLFGYVRGELGIGEDVRTIASALAVAGVEHAAIDVRPDPLVRQAERRLRHALVDRPGHRAVLLAMTGMETVRVIASRGLAELRDRYVIGHWPWELPLWPRAWEGAYDLVDEIWATSRYTRDAFSRAPVPVLLMPPAVELPPGHRRWTRAAFGLPEGAFLFHVSFDFLSYPHRKNPWACLQAFALAFGSAAEPVGLVMKTMRADRASSDWQRLAALAARDRRILLIDRTLGRDATIGLMAACDAYVSLHRAEGFGRGLAEAMLLGRPVIATGFSGSSDFVSERTAFPVDWRPVPVLDGQYPGGDGQFWAEPSVEHAAAQLRRVYEDAALAAAVGAAGRRHAEAAFATGTAGARYRERLEALGMVPPAGR